MRTDSFHREGSPGQRYRWGNGDGEEAVTLVQVEQLGSG